MSSFLLIASISGFLAVALGAFGAHALASRMSDKNRQTYQTAVQYQFYHTMALLLIAMSGNASGLFMAAGWLFIVGMILFSGSLYALSITDKRALGMITPIGGVAFLAGWVCLIVSAI